MELYLLRHADADTEAATDEERALSEKGKEQSHRVAQFFESKGLKPALILASPLRRAQQTAQVLADSLGIELETVRWLACGAKPDGTLRQLAARSLGSVVLVGHEPDMSTLVADLIGAKGGAAIRIRKASLTLIEIVAFRSGGGRLEWSVPSRLM